MIRLDIIQSFDESDLIERFKHLKKFGWTKHRDYHLSTVFGTVHTWLLVNTSDPNKGPGS